MYDEARITVEIVSAIICFVLVRFMIKPYLLTREVRYLGLPLGFLFLGVSFTIYSGTIAAARFSTPINFCAEVSLLQLLIRAFAFVFLAVTYHFSEKRSKNSRLVWDLTFSVLAVVLVALLLRLFVAPQSALQAYLASKVYIRLFNVACLSYIAIHTLRSHTKEPDPTTIWIPLGFILMAVSQYSLLFFDTDNSLAAFTGALALRLLALVIFLFVAYRTFYSSGEGQVYEGNTA
jgi:hypothetical protein